MREYTTNDREYWAYLGNLINGVLSDQDRQYDWLAWLRFRAKVIGPFD